MKKTVFNITNKSVISTQNFDLSKSKNPIEPTTNEWLMNDNGEIFINTDTGKFGAFKKNFRNLNFNDRIIINCEFFSYEGTFPKIAIDDIGASNIITSEIYDDDKIHEKWINASLEYRMTENKNGISVMCGLWTSDKGRFKIRKLSITIFSTSSLSNISEKNFMIRKINGELEIDSQSTHERVSFKTINEFSEQLTFEYPLLGNKKVLVFTTDDAANEVSLVFTAATEWSVILRAKKILDGSLLKIKDIPNGTYTNVCLKQLY